MSKPDKLKRENNSLSPQDNWEKIILILAILMVISLYWRWALPGAITWGDWGYETKSALSDFVPVVWINADSFGKYPMAGVPIIPLVALQGLLSRIFHWDSSMAQRVVIFIPLVLYLIFSPWYLAHTLGFRRIGMATTIIVFNLNSYVFLIAGVTTFALAIALAPFILATFIQTVQRPHAREGLLCALAAALQIIYEVRISYVTFSFCALYLLYFMVTSPPRNRQIILRLGRALLLMTLVVLLIHSYWEIPLLFSRLGDGIQTSLLPTGHDDPGWVRILSYWNLLHVLGLQLPWWGEPGIVNPPHPQFLLLPILVFSLFLFSMPKRKRTLLFFGLAALIFSFLAKGSKPPFGGVYTWLFLHFPGFSMFREPGKWWFPVVLSYAILFAYLVERVGSQKFLERISSWLTKKIHLPSPLIKIGMGIVVIGAFFLIFPVQPISVHRYIHYRYEHPELEPHSEKTYIPRPVPQEYLSLEDFLHKQPNFFRTLWFPNRYRFGYFSSQHPGLSGLDLSGRLSSFCSGNPREGAYTFSYISHPSILLPLRLFSIKYLIVPDAPQGDYGDCYWYGYSPDWYHRIIEETSRFSSVTFQGKTRLYEVSHPLPHLYTSTIPTFIVGNLETLIPLAYSKYLKGRPILFFDEQQEGKSLERLLPQVSTIIFYNSNPSDLVLQLLEPDYRVTIKDRENPAVFKAEKEGSYQIYIQGNEKLEIEIDGKSLILDPESSTLEKAVKWKRIGSVELKKGKHRIVVEKAPQEIVIVPEEKIIQAREKVLNYLKGTKTLPTYFFSKNLSDKVDSWKRRSLCSSFYLPSSGNYSLRAKVSPQYVEALDYGLKEEAGEDGKKWSFIPKNVKYLTSTRKDALIVNTYFDALPEERECLWLARETKPVSLKEYPTFEINYSLFNLEIQRVEVILGVDLNNDRKVDTRIFEELPPGLEKEFRSHSFNLYEKVRNSLGQDLPADASFHLVKVYLKVSKKDGLDCSTPPNKGWYKVSFKDFGLYVLSEDRYVKSRDYVFNERIGLIKKLKRGESKVILSRFFEDLDLEKYPYISLIHQNEDPESLLVSIILDLDFNYDGKSDGEVTYEGVTMEYPFFDAYQLARTKFPDKDHYHLIKLKIKVSKASVFSPGDVSEEPSSFLSLQHLQIYNEEIIPYEKAHLIFPTLKIDRRKLSLTKSESWYTAPTTYLKEGYHILDALFPGIETKLDFVAIEPRAESRERRVGEEGRNGEWEKRGNGEGGQASNQDGQTDRRTDGQTRIVEPEIEFKRINPTKYKVKVKGARESFWLVFSESFHEGWKAYIKPVRSSEFASRPEGTRGPRGRVRSKKDKFEWSALVSAWKDRGKRIGLREHFMVNGYANGWFVPTGQFTVDSLQFTEKEQNGEFEIVVEFVPQRLFEVGVLISGLTLLGCVGYLGVAGVRRKKRRV